MALSNPQIKFLKALAHNKKPVVIVGNKGVSDTVIEEVKTALAHHELIKVKLPAGEKKLRQEMAQEICNQSSAILISHVGRIIVLFLKVPKPTIQLPS